MKVNTIENFLDEKFREFAYYTIHSRAIPSLKDGLKLVQRRSLWVAKDSAKGSDYPKVNTLAGITLRLHPHGDTSVAGAIGNLAQDFAGANNYPLLDGKGSFGNRLSGPGNGIGASRYVGVHLSDISKKILLTDLDLINIIPNYDGEFTECETFLPIVPIAFLNGISGIAVGFAVEIQPYKIEDIIKLQKKVIKGDKLTKKDIPLPWFKGFTGTVYIDSEGIVKCRGVYDLKGKRELTIKDLPIGWTDEQYESFLYDLRDKGTIKDFVNESKEGFDYRIKLPNSFDTSEEHIIKVFKLETNLNQNINFIDTNNKLKNYDTILEAIEEFTNWRFSFYKKRYELYRKNLNEVTVYNKELLRFIQFVLDNDYLKKMSKMSKDKIVKELEGKFKFLDRLLNTTVSNFNMDRITELKQKINDDDDQIEEWTKILNNEKLQKDIYVKELDQIKL